MAAYGGGDSRNAEISEESDRHAVDLSEFVKGCAFPVCVCVCEGNYLSKTVQISRGDVLFLKSCEEGQVTLSYRDEVKRSWNEVNVPVDFPQKFIVLPPKDVHSDDRVISMVTYPTISDLLIDSPTYFETTTAYDDPYLPGMSVRPGDRFWFEEVVIDKDGNEKLKVKDELDNILILSSDCRGNFCPLEDKNTYTIKQLIDFAPVQRRLKMVNSGKPHDSLDGGMISAMKCVSNDDQGRNSKAEASARKRRESTSSSGSSSSSHSLNSGPLFASFTGVIHMLKPEPTVVLSPNDDYDTVWNIPLSSNLRVRRYSQNDYEIPAPRSLNSHPSVPLPTSFSDDQVPKYQAPSVPPIAQPLIPVNIQSFVDIYQASFPVRAKILDTSESNSVYQKLLKNVDEVNVYRLDEAPRLFVKDAKSKTDIVYSLSQDLKLSFVEYPEKFTSVKELLHLPLGSKVTVLEDIAADFPKPFSLRLGDTIQITTNTPYVVKMKYANDCHVLKCDRIDPEGGEPIKIKIPLDFDVKLMLSTDPQEKKMISLQDILYGRSKIPTQIVASVPDQSEIERLKELPVDLQILKTMKELNLVVASTKPVKPPLASSSSTPLPPTSTPSALGTRKGSFESKSSSPSQSKSQKTLTNIGLPTTSGVVIAFRERLDIFELDILASEADYIRVPVEKMSLADFEERDRFYKLNVNYEDVEFESRSTHSESGSLNGTNLMRTGSTGILERKNKKTKMDKVRRLSRALNPKHWRNSKAEPEPLPHPSAMGLMALAARPSDNHYNDYAQPKIESASTVSGSSTTDLSSDEGGEDGNFYEDVEIGPIKSATFASSPTAARQTDAFSGPQHKSMPLSSRMPTHLFSRNSTPKTPKSDTENKVTSSHDDTHIYDVPSPGNSKPKSWMPNFHKKPQYDVPTNNKAKDSRATTKCASSLEQPSSKGHTLDSLFTKKKSASKEHVDDDGPPVPPRRKKWNKSSTPSEESSKGQNDKKEEIIPPPRNTSLSKTLSDSPPRKDINSKPTTPEISIDTHSEAPKPKPRGINKNVTEGDGAEKGTESEQSNDTERQAKTNDIVKEVKTLSLESKSSEGSPPTVSREGGKPIIPPKPRSKRTEV